MLKRLFAYLGIVIIVYLYIHNPLLSFINGIGAAKILYFVLPFLCVVLSSNPLPLFKKYKWYWVSVVLMLVYLTVITGGEFAYVSLVSFIEIVVLPILLVNIIKVIDINYESILLSVGIIGSIISTLCIVDPSINEIVKYIIQVLQSGSFLDINEYRGFGLSDALTSSYGIVQGALLALLFNKMNEKKWLLVFVPFFVLSILLNARTGIIVAALGIVLSVLYKKRIGALLGIVLLAVLVLSSIPILLSYFDISKDSILFITDFVDEITFVIQNKSLDDNGASSDLLGRGFVIPSNIISIIFGEGHYIMGAKGLHSDVGFSNDIFMGGIIYCILAYRIVLQCLSHLNRFRSMRFYTMLTLITILIANIKGIVFPNSGELRFVVFFAFCLLESSNYSYYKTMSK